MIAVTHDSAHVIPDWLAGLESAGDRDKMEVCVVDSGSSEEQLRLMDGYLNDRVDTFLKLPNVGFGTACNAGAEATTSSVVLFTNPDIRLQSLPARAFDGDNLGDTLIGAFARNPDRPLAFTHFPRFRDEALKLLVGAWFRSYERCAEDPAWVSGAALMVERSAFRRIGGFSPEFFLYFEDVDLCARHQGAGGTIEVDPGFVVEHRHGGSTTDERRRPLTAAIDSVNRLSARRFAKRHGGRWQGPLLFLLLALAYVPRRLAVAVLRERTPIATAVADVALLLRPQRALRVLGATESHENS